MEPTKTQQEIITQEGNVVVMATPGSGKTYVISEKIKRLLLENEMRDYQGVIAISYTRKASAHLKERALDGGISGKNSFFGTIDSFCLTQIVLGFGDYVIGYPEKEVTPIDLKDLPKEQREDFTWLTEIHPDYDEVDEEEWHTLFDFYRKGYVVIQSLELMALHVFRGSIACRNYMKARFRYVFIDEYQDADTYTDELFRELVALGLTGIAVGDKNQSIFSFAHKDSRYLQALCDDDDFKKYLLDTNFRCAPSIINYSNRLLNGKCELIDAIDNGMAYVLVEGGEEAIADFLSSYIPMLCEKNKVEDLNEVAILVRNTRTQTLIDQALTIPHRLVETTVLDQELNPCSRLYAELLQFYFDPSMRLLSVLDRYLDFDDLNLAEKRELSQLKNEIRKVTEDNRDSLLELFRRVAKIVMPNQGEGLSAEKLREVLVDEKMLTTYMPASKDEIVLMTLHKSKGLEFDFVFHLNMNEWELPLKLPKEGDFNNTYYPAYEQDLDLHYVGITRAKKACVLVGGTLRTNSRGATSTACESEFLSINGLRGMRTNLYYSEGEFKRLVYEK